MDDKTSLVTNFFENPLEDNFIELWNLNSDMAMKCLFYILDQRKNSSAFLNIYTGWVYQNYKKVFFKNLSLILGIYNEKILTDNQLRKIAKKDYEINELRLNEMVYKDETDNRNDYREAFRKEFFSRARQTYFSKIYKIPVYGNIDIVREIQERLNMDKLVFYTIEHLVQKYKMKECENPNPKPNFEQQYQFVSGNSN